MKLCLWCKHFRFDSGHPDWSEVTPGDSAEIRCSKNYWELGHNNDQNDLLRAFAQAESCPDWEPIDVWKKDNQ